MEEDFRSQWKSNLKGENYLSDRITSNTILTYDQWQKSLKPALLPAQRIPLSVVVQMDSFLPVLPLCMSKTRICYTKSQLFETKNEPSLEMESYL
jgi:hypothetical protein